MIKIIGAIFIIVATTWTGFEASRNFSERPRQLRMLRSSLQSLEAEIARAYQRWDELESYGK